MTAISEFVDAVRNGGNFSSDMGLATKMGISRQTLHAWRKGTAPLPDERIAQMCALGKLDGAEWMARIHAEKAQSREERALWRSMLDRLSAAAAVVALMLPFAGGLRAENLVNSTGYQAPEAHSLYIMYGSRWHGSCSGSDPTTDGASSMRDRALTGPWAGFSFQRGHLITPEGRAISPQDLAWLGLTTTLAREWRLLMEDDRARVPPRRPAGVAYLRAVSRRYPPRIITAIGAEAFPARLRRSP